MKSGGRPNFKCTREKPCLHSMQSGGKHCEKVRGNALEAMPNGGSLTIESRTIQLSKGVAAPTHVRIEFRDTGCGMDAESRERAFTSLLNTSKPGGTGLGLAIVGRIVESHGGRLEIKPSDSGTNFSILLPIRSQ